MRNAVSVREATEADLVLIEPLIPELFEAMEEPPDIGIPHAIENCRALIKDPSYHVLVAQVGGSVVGFVSFSTRRTITHPGPSALIDELIVAEKYRRQGIGKHLIRAAMQKCRSVGCVELEVTTEKTNTGAREFYKKCGFTEGTVFLEKQLDH